MFSDKKNASPEFPSNLSKTFAKWVVSQQVYKYLCLVRKKRSLK